MLNLGSILFGLGADTSGLQKAQRDIEQFGSQSAATIARAKAAIDALNEASKKAASNNGGIVSLLKGITESSALTLGPLDGLTYRMRAATQVTREFGLGIGVGLGAVAGFTVGIVAMSEQLIKNIIAVQQTEMTIKGITNSAATATGELGFLRDVANQAGFAFTDLAPNFARFVASATSAGQSLSVTNQEFKELALLTGTLHLSSGEMNNVIMAFDHMLSSGRVTGQQLRQLFNNMPAVFSIAAAAGKQMGVNIFDAMRKGSVASGEFIQTFLALGDKMFNIDLTKPIQSLQASIGRLKGDWQNFVISFGEAIDAGGGFMSLFTNISSVLKFLTANIQTVIQVLGAFTGALAGLAAVLAINALIGILGAGISALTTTILFIIVQTGVWVTEMGVAVFTTEELTAAQGLLNVVMDANPIGALAALIGLLTGAYFGLKTGLDMVNNVQAQMSHQMADTSSIDSYIAAAKQAQSQTASLTAELMKNTQAKLANNLAMMQDTSKALTSAKEQMVELNKAVNMNIGGGPGTMEEAAGYAMMAADAEKSTAKVMELSKTLKQQSTDVINLSKALKGLSEVSYLPESGKVAPGRPKSVTPKDGDRGLRSMDDIINKAKEAQIALDNMWKGPIDSGALASYEEAVKRIFDLKPDQKSTLVGLMGGQDAVNSVGGLTSAMAVFIEQGKMANDTVKQFDSIWNDINKESDKGAGLRADMAFLMAGGDPDNMPAAKTIARVREELDKLKSSATDAAGLRSTLEAITNPTTGKQAFNTAAIDQIMKSFSTDKAAGLAAIVKYLDSIGIHANTAEEGLSKLFGGTDALAQQVKNYKDIAKSISEASSAQDVFNAKLKVFQTGGSLQDFRLVDVLQKAKDELDSMSPEQLNGVVKALQDYGIEGNNAVDMLGRFYLAQEDLKTQTALITKAMEDQVQAWVDLGTSSVDTIQQILTGASTLKDGVLNIIKEMANTILKTAIFDPIKTRLSSAVRAMAGGMSGDFADPLNGGSGSAVGQSANLLKAAIDKVSPALGVELFGSVTKNVLGTTTEVGARSANIITLNSATTALAVFTDAVLTAASANASQAGSSFFETAAAAAVMVSTGGYVQRLAGGGLSGLIRGPGGPRDDKIPTLLSNREFVVNADAAARNLPLLFAINSGQDVGAMAGGGAVGGISSGSSKTLLTGQQKNGMIDASTTIHINGNVDSDTFAQMRAYLDQRDMQLRAEIPYMIDARVPESINRGRYS